ncbi:hypothetical protein EJ08DRAFT_645530 [Tothia fuscella]|uniref:Uncharacterized protein n=1 Tax=Tothia fuscella TaxID=1048955 RepID=A0A9P4U496_9PEZI|nr:hypothetical protein EJ08DRAFT_645530 [Tothia fuscella]
MVHWLALALPFAYLGVLVGIMASFSRLYRQNKARKAASLAPWFGPHLQRDLYLSLLHIEPDEKTPRVPESILKAALLRRATEDIHRIISIRNTKSALAALLQRGSVGDDLWQRFQRAEKEIEEELRDVVNEANAFSPNWGATIFQSANEMASNQMIRKRMDELQAQKDSERQWWDHRKASIESDFMNELDRDAATANSAPPAKTAPATSTRVSDDDTVLVEAGGPADKGQSGKNKKKKGKN